jgi:hypothetical protein
MQPRRDWLENSRPLIITLKNVKKAINNSKVFLFLFYLVEGWESDTREAAVDDDHGLDEVGKKGRTGQSYVSSWKIKLMLGYVMLCLVRLGQ